jgi:hypothetical protein
MKNQTSDLLLRLGVAFSFLYPPLDAFINPYSWIGYLPRFIRGVLPDMVLLHGFGIIEIAIALWILSGRRIFWPCMIAAGILLVIVALNLRDFEVLFRDLAIAAMALGLALMHRPARNIA